MLRKPIEPIEEGSEKPTLAYWDVRGKGAQVHYIMAYCGVDYNKKVYIRGPAPEFSKSDWTSDRDRINLGFPNLPYLIDSDFKLTESKSIMKYIAKKYDESLLGTTPEEMARADMMSRIHDTLYDQIGRHFKDGEPEKFVREIDVVGQIIANYMSDKKPFIAG